MASQARRQSTVRALALSCHPVPTVGVTVISAGLAALAGLGFGPAVAFTAAVFIGQLSIGWSNDWIDAARDRESGRSDKPVAGGSVAPRTVAAAAGIGLVLAVGVSMSLGWRAGSATSVQFVAGWLYNFGLKSTVLSWVPYAVGFGALPAGAVLARSEHPWPQWWAVAAGAVLGSAAHAANVLPDLKADRATGVRGLWHLLGARTTAIAGPVLLVVASAFVLLGPGRITGWKWSALAVIAVFAAGGLSVGLRNPDGRGLFAATIALAGVDLLLFGLSGAQLY
jgi:4-hydroxybenzoate polyprenyltransferase